MIRSRSNLFGKTIGAMLIASCAMFSYGAFAQQTGYTLPNKSIAAGRLAVTNSIDAPPPTVAGASCGTPVLTAGSTDFAGQFQAKGTTTCKLTFGTAKTVAPFCIVADQTTAALYTVSTTGITMGTTVSNDFINYVCFDTSNF